MEFMASNILINNLSMIHVDYCSEIQVDKMTNGEQGGLRSR